MSTTRMPGFRLAAIVAACSCASLMLCPPAFAQSSQGAEWATSEAGASLNDDSPPLTDDSATAVITPARTPIQRDEPPSTEQTSLRDVGRRSWTWAWLPIGLVVVLWWIVNRIRQGKSRHPGLLPEGVIVPLGMRSVGGGYVVQLIRIGSRILVVAPSADGLKTLTEIDDPQEVERLVSLCLQPHQGASGIVGLFGGRSIRTESQTSHSPTTDGQYRPSGQHSRAGHVATASREVSR